MPDERKDTTTAVLMRALRRLAIRHIYTRPYTAKPNGRAERFIQTLPRGWT